VIGGPGVGKTALLRWLARICVTDKPSIQGRLGWAEEKLTPILMSIAVFADARKDRPNLTLRSFLDQQMTELGGDLLRTAVDVELANGRVFLLIDGVDEVPDSRIRSNVVRAVDRFIARHARNRCLVTSRPYGYVPLGGQVERFEMVNFNQEQVESFTYKWQRASERRQHPSAPDLARADAQAEAVLTEINRSPKIRELASNPLMLVIIISLIYYEERRLPERRVQLYEQAVRTLMDTWSQWRSLTDLDVGGEQLATDRLIRVWGAVAEWTWRTRPAGVTHRAELERKLVEILKEKKLDDDYPEITAAGYLNSAARAGLLEERGKDVFAFWHHTFEEFLAAVELATPTSKAIDRILAVRDDPHWREVILLAVGYVGIVLRDDETATAIVEAIASQGLGPAERLFHRGLRLAAACIADDVGIRRTLTQRILAQLADVVRQWPLARREGERMISWRVPEFDRETTFRTAAGEVKPTKARWVRVMEWPYQQFNDAFFTAVMALPRLRPSLETLAAIAPLADHLNHYVQTAVALLCSNAATTCAIAHEICRRLVADEFGNTACLAALGLARVGEFDEAVVGALAQAQELGYVEPVLNFLADEISQEAVDRVIAALGSPEPHLRLQAALLLLSLGQAETKASNTLLSLLSSACDSVRITASEELNRIGQADGRVLCVLQELLDAKDDDIHLRAASLLIEKGAANEYTEQALRSRWYVSAAELLHRMGRTNEDDVERLYEVLDLFVPLDLDAATLLFKIGGTEERLADSLISALEAGHIKLHRLDEALELLQNMGRTDKTVQALNGWLGSEDPWLRFRGAEGLILMGRLEEPAVEAAMACLSADDPNLRMKAATLLREIGAVDERVVTSVANIVKPDFDTASAAVQRLLRGEPVDERDVDSLVELFRIREQPPEFPADLPPEVSPVWEPVTRVLARAFLFEWLWTELQA